MKIQGCVVLVTGGARGIGKAISQTLAAKGAKVCVVDVNATSGGIVVEELKLSSGAENIIFVQADVSSQDQLEVAFKTARSTFGRLDVVVNNAAIVDEKNWRACVNVNLVGVLSGTMLALDYMGEKHGGGGGVIINIASLAGLAPGQFPLAPVYDATKAAVIAHTLAWNANPRCRQDGFRFNAICPNTVDTPLLGILTTELLPNWPAVDLEAIKSTMKLKPSDVAEVVVDLIEDDDKNGAIIKLTLQGGAERVSFAHQEYV